MLMEANAQAEQILQTARETGENPPEGWTVIPVNRPTVQRQILGWSGSAALGIVLFAWLFVALYPSFNFLTIFILIVLAFLGLGSLWLLVKSLQVLLNADQHLIVMTPDLYVQQRGAAIVSVPMRDIDHITLRGVFGGDAAYTQMNDLDVDNAVMNFSRMLGGSRSRRPRRTPDSLAFVDARSDAPVTIAEDNSFADLPVIEEILRNYVNNARRARNV